ncbi:hypothetical protein H5410_026617, partial [Solanum commersonii]
MDDIELIGEIRNGFNSRLEMWRQTLETKQFRLSRTYTEYLECRFNDWSGDIDREITFCIAMVLSKLKGKFYRVMVRPTLLYGTECWLVKKIYVQKMHVVEIRILRWMSYHTRSDKIRNEDIWDKVGVTFVVEKMRETILKWFGHVKRRCIDTLVKRCKKLYEADVGQRSTGIGYKTRYNATL